MAFPQPEPEPLSMGERVILWALVTLPLIGAALWLAK
jgi:hypothetical protein